MPPSESYSSPVIKNENARTVVAGLVRPFHCDPNKVGSETGRHHLPVRFMSRGVHTRNHGVEILGKRHVFTRIQNQIERTSGTGCGKFNVTSSAAAFRTGSVVTHSETVYR